MAFIVNCSETNLLPAMNKFLLTLCFIFIASLIEAQNPTSLNVNLVPLYSGLNNPVGIYHCNDNRLFVLEQSQGDIEIIDTNGVYIGKFLDLTSLISTGGERGLLGMAFHPDYLSNGYFYVNYTNLAGNTVIARYTVSANPNVANASSAFILLTITQDFSNHNGGHIAFGPDGYLYIGMGDGGSGGDPNNRAQNPLSRLGKMLRIDVDNGTPYGIPASNPYFGQTDTLPEIWAMGMRNPWKFSFDELTGDMWIGDVGQNAQEEIDFEPAGSPGGSNWGWRCYEGLNAYSTTSLSSNILTAHPIASAPLPVVSSIAVPNSRVCMVTTSSQTTAPAPYIPCIRTEMADTLKRMSTEVRDSATWPSEPMPTATFISPTLAEPSTRLKTTVERLIRSLQLPDWNCRLPPVPSIGGG
jgi:glucose/arabinose dehydrogenase